MPGRSVGDKGVPPAAAPPLGDALAFNDKVPESMAAQMLTHRDAGLAATDNEYLHLLD
jgi:hypothetical protein